MRDDTKSVEKLPGDLRRIAEVTDLATAIIIAENFGGAPLMIPKCSDLIREIRNKKIREDYDSGKHTIRELVWKYRLDERTIRRILKEVGEEIPLPLLELMQQA